MPRTPEQRYDRAMRVARRWNQLAVRSFAEGRTDSIISRSEFERCALIREIALAYEAGALAALADPARSSNTVRDAAT